MTFDGGLDQRLTELNRLEELEADTAERLRLARIAKSDAEDELAAYLLKQLGQLPDVVLRKVAQAFRESDTGTIDRF